MEVVSLDVGTGEESSLLHGKDRGRRCPPLGLNFKPSLMVIIVLNFTDGNASFCSFRLNLKNVIVVFDMIRVLYHFDDRPRRCKKRDRAIFKTVNLIRNCVGVKGLRKSIFQQDFNIQQIFKIYKFCHLAA